MDEFKASRLAMNELVVARGRLLESMGSGLSLTEAFKAFQPRYLGIDFGPAFLLEASRQFSAMQSMTDKLTAPFSAVQAALWDSVAGRETVFARELRQLKEAGYKFLGDYMVPP